MRRSFKKFLERERGERKGRKRGREWGRKVGYSLCPSIFQTFPRTFIDRTRILRRGVRLIEFSFSYFSFLFFFFSLGGETSTPPFHFLTVVSLSSFNLLPSLASINLDPHEIALPALFHSLDSTNEPSFLPFHRGTRSLRDEFDSHRATKLVIINRNRTKRCVENKNVTIFVIDAQSVVVVRKRILEKLGYQGY